MKGYCRGKGLRSHSGPWAPYGKIDHVRGEDVGAKRAPGPALVGLKMFRRLSEEKCLLGRNKYGSNMHYLLEGPTPTSISNKDESPRPVGRKEA